ncbi:erythromycin esterase [Gramella sp. Hel_I_59]|uniref:erythromycin esterase family protein n=1 Tax=Gramella sp. Hel_I_59 TaxID=1249978 RepID=UPI001151B579|nr:erythromycin esterase family protein [Gramella sp. Hel_I_59]TQI71124.1 erythromycin esterase [Gramella sp. Hel_I_59]
MRYLLIVFLLLTITRSYSQNKKTVNWINNNLIKIEDSNPDSSPENFIDNIPNKFENAKIFGFGEATHHGKEFFNIKAKFFKYLVVNKNVRAFLMEESYPAESGINEWISGGKGDINSIAENFSILPWRTQEVANLLKWMRSYNLNKPREEQIRFYGIDIQNVQGINIKIREFAKAQNILIDENLLSVLDKCVNKKVNYNATSDWADKHNPELQKIKNIILDSQIKSSSNSHQETRDVLRSLDYLMDYTYYVQNNGSNVRDLKMFENAEHIIDSLTKNGKAFIWAHNEHINNLERISYGSGWTSLGAHLNERYQNDYYSVGFDFGVGNLLGYVAEKNKPHHWEIFTVDKPFKRTYSKTLFEANANIFFLDINKLSQDDEIDFFNKKEKQLILGGPGYNPKDFHLIPKKISEMYDGLIFVKKISVPDYNLENL